jgi:hypothetical protein
MMHNSMTPTISAEQCRTCACDHMHARQHDTISAEQCLMLVMSMFHKTCLTEVIQVKLQDCSSIGHAPIRGQPKVRLTHRAPNTLLWTSYLHPNHPRQR